LTEFLFSFLGVTLDGSSSKTLQDSFNNFRASALGLPIAKKVGDKTRNFPARDDRKRSNKGDKKPKDSKEIDDVVDLLNERSDENVDDLAGKVDDLKLEVSADTAARKKTGNHLFENFLFIVNFKVLIKMKLIEDKLTEKNLGLNLHHLDYPTKSEAARANISDDQVGAKTRKLYALNQLPKERQAELKFQVRNLKHVYLNKNKFKI